MHPTPTPETLRESGVNQTLTPDRRAAKRPPRYRENDKFAAFARRIVRAFTRRVGEQGDIDALGELYRLRRQADEAIVEAIVTLRSAPWCYSWTRIGEQLGMSKQAAEKRYGDLVAGRVNGARKPGGIPAHLRDYDPLRSPPRREPACPYPTRCPVVCGLCR